MRSLHVILFMVVLFSCELSFAKEGDYRSTVMKLELKDGDTLVFWGDSITQQCLYTQYVEDYFYTRYPDCRIRFHNAGVDGDRTTNAIARFEQDVSAFEPTYVTVLLGMNDGSYKHFDHAVFTQYENGMNQILDMIDGIEARAFLMGSTIFDSGAVKVERDDKPSMERRAYYNSVMAFYGAWLREQAYKRGLGYVDMGAYLNRYTLQKRQENPTFTMIPDTVHPAQGGQVVMACALLEELNVSDVVSEIELDCRPNGGTVKTVNADVSNIVTSNTYARFDVLSKSLPWVLPANAHAAYEMVGAGQNLSRETLEVNGLQDGLYELVIDDTVVGRFDAEALNDGIELQDNNLTPQYQQAMQVAIVNQEKNQEAVRPLRVLWHDLKMAGGMKEKDPDKYKSIVEKLRNNMSLKQKEIAEYNERVYTINKPVKRKDEIKLLE